MTVFLVFTSCKKDELILPESTEPVFSVTGTLDGNEINLVAGDNGAFMHTKTLIENRVNVYTGDLSDGTISVEIGIFDGFVDMPGGNTVDGITNIIPIFASQNVVPLTTLSKSMMQNASNISEIIWTVDDSTYSDDHPIWEPGIYNVCAHITYYDLTEEDICEDLIIGYAKSANCAINFTTDQSGYMSVDIDDMGTPVDYVVWTLDGSVVPSTSSSYSATVGMYNHYLEAEVHFTNGVVRKKAAIVDASSLSTHNIHGLTVFEIVPTAISGPQDFNLRLRIQNGSTIYYSALADNSSSTIILTGFEYFGKNAANNDVYKITADINAHVATVAGGNSVPVSLTTTFGVEILP